MGNNLVDQWADEEKRNDDVKKAFKGDPKGLAASRKGKGKGKVEYLINANCKKVNSKYNANPSGTHESKALLPVIASFIDTDAKIQTMLDIETGWKGAQLDGTQYLQMFKEPTDEKNRKRLWGIFHVSIHEYIHTLAAPKYKTWAESLGGSEEHTLIEGFCDFFTLNVRAKFPSTSLGAYQKAVEGPYHDPKAKIPSPSELGVGVYGSNASAERMVGIIGINNAQRGYFQGAVELMGK